MLLGKEYRIIEEGMGGRTTVWDDPLEPLRNGLTFLPVALQSHQPLDLVILSLGTLSLIHIFFLPEDNSMKQPLIDLVGISKSFGGELVLDDLNLSVKENSFVTLLGPSGCGKTTTLRIIGGFTSPDSGKEMCIRDSLHTYNLRIPHLRKPCLGHTARRIRRPRARLLPDPSGLTGFPIRSAHGQLLTFLPALLVADKGELERTINRLIRRHQKSKGHLLRVHVAEHPPQDVYKRQTREPVQLTSSGRLYWKNWSGCT